MSVGLSRARVSGGERQGGDDEFLSTFAPRLKVVYGKTTNWSFESKTGS
jgi:hypothetical protein